MAVNGIQLFFFQIQRIFLNFHILCYLSFKQLQFLLGIFKYSVLCLLLWRIQKKVQYGLHLIKPYTFVQGGIWYTENKICHQNSHFKNYIYTIHKLIT